ncbi:unnamed protein product [Closterium sp. Yama58-4]|nr:unnamed protein product [Closterium sp. Yama58-4]
MAAFAGKWEAFGQTKVAALKAAVAQGVAQSQQMFEKEKPVQLTPVEQETKVKELRASLGPLPKRAQIFCSDACLRRYLRARNWHVQRAERMLRDTLKWRDQCRPEEIRWADVAEEGATGKVYRTAFQDKHGRPVVVLSAGQQNTNNHAGQVRHLVHCLENAVMNLPATAREQQQPQQQDNGRQGEQQGGEQGGQEQMVWLIDFRGWSMRKAPPLKTSREVLSILQSHYPERLGAAVIYNPPAVFEAFWKVIRPFIDPVTFNKILFVNPSKPDTVKKLEGIFDLDRLEEAFGGRSKWTYDHARYGEMMARDDEKTAEYWGIVEGERLGQQQAIVGDETIAKDMLRNDRNPEPNTVKELRASLGPLPKRARIFCSDACLRRYLRARNWHVQRAERMLRDTLKWRHHTPATVQGGPHTPHQPLLYTPLVAGHQQPCGAGHQQPCGAGGAGGAAGRGAGVIYNPPAVFEAFWR